MKLEEALAASPTDRIVYSRDGIRMSVHFESEESVSIVLICKHLHPFVSGQLSGILDISNDEGWEPEEGKEA
jgi:hypothetical protein